jgi:putative ABC transport system permease protein
MLKLISAVIVVIAISGPYLKKQFPLMKRQLAAKFGKAGM